MHLPASIDERAISDVVLLRLLGESVVARIMLLLPFIMLVYVQLLLLQQLHFLGY